MKLLFTSFLLILTLSCKKETATSLFSTENQKKSNIVNGLPVSSADILTRHTVLISTVDDTGKNEICTGVFVSKNQILTAAHCIAQNVNDMSVTFRTADYDSDSNVIDLPILKIQKFEKINKTNNRQDLALIEINSPKNFEAVPVEILKTKPLISNLILVGLGSTGQAELIDSVLRSKTVSVSTDQLLKINFEIDQNKNQGGVCFGDSGGPALFFDQKLNQYFLVGIASAVVRGENLDACLNKSIFINILFYKTEIGELL